MQASVKSKPPSRGRSALKTPATRPAAGSDRARIEKFLRKYTPAIAAQLREARRRLRANFPRGFELVFDNYNALVFAISPTQRSADAFVSVAGYPKWVTLFFIDGADLDDPHGLLAGEGKHVRSIRLKTPEDIDEPGIALLIAQASARHATAFDVATPVATLVKSEVAKQRPRRPPAAKRLVTKRPGKRK